MNNLMAASVSVRDLCADAGNNFGVAVDKLHQPGPVKRSEVVRIVGAGQLGNVAVRIFPFGSLDEMTGARKSRSKLTFGIAVGRAAGVVEVKVGQHHPVEI